MKIKRATLQYIQLPLQEPMTTSYGIHESKDAILVILETYDGVRGIAECVAMKHPTYTEETVTTAWYIMSEYILPRLCDKVFESPSDIDNFMKDFVSIRGHHMAKAAVEMSLWDTLAAETETPLYQLLGGEERDIPVGISIGIAKTTDFLLRSVEKAVAEGYQRIKLKVSPALSEEPIAAVRAAFPSIPLMADANSSYTMADVSQLVKLDMYDLMMIEQPLAHDDLVQHAILQQQIRTPICLDESIRSARDVDSAAHIGAGRIINLKPGRVGGFTNSKHLLQRARENHMDVWCGGMYETGVGRLHSIALCSLPGFSLPTDIGPSDRYFVNDILISPVQFSRPGFLHVHSLCGVNSVVDWNRVQKYLLQEQVVTA